MHAERIERAMSRPALKTFMETRLTEQAWHVQLIPRSVRGSVNGLFDYGNKGVVRPSHE
jgi:hypothetical protein